MKFIVPTIQREQTYYGMLMVALLTTFIIVHLSLYPYLGWKDIGIGSFEYLTGPWIPVHQTILWDDIFVNILAYIPLGLTLTLGLIRLPKRLELILVPILGLSLSLLLEATQTWIPSRVPSKMDVLTNLMGTTVGTVIAHLIDRYRVWPTPAQQWLHQKAWIGVILIGLWFISLFAPTGHTFVLGVWLGNWFDESALQGNKSLFGLPEWLILSAEQWLLQLGSLCFLLAMLMIGLLQVQRKRPKFWLSIALLIGSLIVSQLHWLINHSLLDWLNATKQLITKNYIPVIMSMMIVLCLIYYQASSRLITRLSLTLIVFGWIITILFPGIYPPELLQGGQGITKIFRDLQQASAWVGQAWPLLSLIVLTFVCVEPPQLKR